MPEEVERVLKTFRSYHWQVPGAGELVLGWIGVCFVSTALRRRPHVLVTGPHGSGKSTLLEQVSMLLGPQGAPVTGSPTLMGLQQLVQHHPSRGIVIDEFESDGRNARRKGVFEAARASYSLQEGDAGVVRGSTTGEAKTYRLSSPFLAGAISPGSMEPADVSRWVSLELGRLAERAGVYGPPPTRDEFQRLGPGLARLFVARWPVLSGSLPLFRQAVCDVGGDARQADTYGHLLACYWTFVSGNAATALTAAQLVEELRIGARFRTHAVHDEEECLSALFTRLRTFDGVDGGSVKLSIGEACKLVVDGLPGKKAVMARLGQLGMRLRVARATGRWHLMVANSPSHAELRRLFSGTKWSQGGWGIVLRRLPGGHESTQRIVSGMPSAKVTAFELPDSMQPMPSEGEA
jgi:energy-coupling factor transporter ATP-binding protein EcfA2